MAAPQRWRFEQKGGAKRTFELSGWSAPFGRARTEAVVADTTKIRYAITRYAGARRTTLHSFGSHVEPWTLHGRFRDRALGEGGALDKAEALRAFTMEEQELKIFWGSILYAEGVIVEFTRGIEAESEVTWELQIEILEEPTQVGRPPTVRTSFEPPQVATARMVAALGPIHQMILPPRVGGVPFATDVLVQLGGYIAILTSAVGQVRSATDTMTSVANATFGEIRKLTGAISTAREAMLNTRRLIETLRPEALRNRLDPSDEVKLFEAQATGETSLRQMLLDAAELDRQARITKAQRSKTTYQARDGDTWESISTHHYGTPSRAPDLQDANDIEGGQKPRKGAQYNIPE